ncbi:MAG: HD domain-containing protein [Proteobacteria bacterium]|nr:HD domain-containing protein [Pseudomonadota bacterium]
MNPDQKIILCTTHGRRSLSDFYPQALELERRGVLNAIVRKGDNAALGRAISEILASGASSSILTVNSREIHQQVRELETLALGLAGCYKNNDNAGFIGLIDRLLVKVRKDWRPADEKEGVEGGAAEGEDRFWAICANTFAPTENINAHRDAYKKVDIVEAASNLLGWFSDNAEDFAQERDDSFGRFLGVLSNIAQLLTRVAYGSHVYTFSDEGMELLASGLIEPVPAQWPPAWHVDFSKEFRHVIVGRFMQLSPQEGGLSSEEREAVYQISAPEVFNDVDWRTQDRLQESGLNKILKFLEDLARELNLSQSATEKIRQDIISHIFSLGPVVLPHGIKGLADECRDFSVKSIKRKSTGRDSLEKKGGLPSVSLDVVEQAKGHPVESLSELKELKENVRVVLSHLVAKYPRGGKSVLLHLEAVSGLARRLADAYGFDRKTVLVFEITGLIHDIGKLQSEEIQAVLVFGENLKKTDFTQRQYRFLDRHEIISLKMLTSTHEDWVWLNIPLRSHIFMLGVDKFRAIMPEISQYCEYSEEELKIMAASFRICDSFASCTEKVHPSDNKIQSTEDIPAWVRDAETRPGQWAEGMDEDFIIRFFQKEFAGKLTGKRGAGNR